MHFTSLFHNSQTLTPDPPDVLVTPSNFVSQEGKKITFTCEAFGIPLPSLTWSHQDGTEIQLQEGVVEIKTENKANSTGSRFAVSNLTFHSVHDTNEAVYICHGENDVSNLIGTPESDTGEIVISVG